MSTKPGGLQDATCTADICAFDSYCCDTEWDGICADEASQFCTVCGGTPPPESGPNDACVDATKIESKCGEQSVPFSNVSATSGATSACGLMGSDIWYLYEAGEGSQVTVSTCGNANYDTVLTAFGDFPDCATALGNCEPTNDVDCNDDNPGCGLQSEIEFEASSGGAYFIQVGGFAGSQGTGNLVITEDCTPVVQIERARDDCQAVVEADPGSDAADKLEDVVGKLDDVLKELDKDPPDQQAAVGNLEGAVGDLEAAVKDGYLDLATGIAKKDQLAGAAREMAADAIAEAFAQGGDPDVIEEAEDYLAEGDELRASGNGGKCEDFKPAVAKYKDALSKAEGEIS